MIEEDGKRRQERKTKRVRWKDRREETEGDMEEDGRKERWIERRKEE